jgi:predicted transposase/invertase (TIGR01784 family)
MVQYRKQAGKKLLDDPLNRWMAWLNKRSPPELIAEVLKMDRAIKAAAKKLDLITRDKDFLRYYHLRLMAMSDRTTEINTATEEGLKKGRAEGMEKRNLEIARNLKSLGVSTNIIIKSTGLSPEEIAEL